ncbi:cytochrome P450 [Candidatus Berkiella aquae]|nr:cytochrome P450 [Candidatus Berkiella aquae]MCS5710659.1 cytochrome P450 [Candidatus Berkiella aquae]
MAFRYIYWLLKRNGITAPAGKDPLWHYLLEDLTSAAFESEDGFAIKDLYIINNRILKIRGFSLISLTHNAESIKNFCDVNAREAYLILGGLIQLPIINASDWSPESQQEKHQLIRTLHQNSYRLWISIKKSCQHLPNTWHPGQHLPFNISMQAFSILGSVLFSLDALPNELFPLIERFEQIWGNPQQFSAHDLRENVEAFQHISQILHQQRENISLEQPDLLKNVHKNQQPRVLHLHSDQNINIAAYFAFFENMSKAMISLFTVVFAKEKWLSKIIEERKRLKRELHYHQISANSEEGFNYILKHSEIFDRFHMEVLRFWSVAPVIPRINNNLIANKILSWGDDMRILDDFTLPPRSLAIVPQYAISRSAEWSNPNQFNPMRDEYGFGKKPLAQGAENSFRRCPAKEMTRKYFYAMMWWFPKYNEVHLTKEERKILRKSLAKDAFYRPLTTVETQLVIGKLKGKERCQVYR